MSSLNIQRPLAPETSASGSSHADSDFRPTVPLTQLPQRKKKPGPKRDSKPAPSEKLERNRQAQRTHRERKEKYTKELELEVLRLKELFAGAARERDNAFSTRDQALQEAERLRQENQHLQTENQRMKEVIQSSSSSTDSGDDGMSVTCDATRNNSFSTTDGYPGMTAPVALQPGVTGILNLAASDGAALDGGRCSAKTEMVPLVKQESPASSSQLQLMTELQPVSINYDDLGLDFILSLERPCMGHIQFLHVRAHNVQTAPDGSVAGRPLEVPDDGENQNISGHSLMATSIPFSHIMANPNARYPTQFPTDLKREDLLKLLDLSSQLEINEIELPPVKAWIKIMRDGRLGLFSVNDFAVLKQKLLQKVHCYRFGAVIEEQDIDEALSQVLEYKTTGTLPPAPSTSCAIPTTSPLPAH
ncbi:hypothetical protein DOTSEDRAFT_48335 [Lecanosticta acicola]|uniref:BZIP domain-containing protein n=1 Tax=Lecanosticta acicola TaxID=111012 RepID=A0AAI8W1R4_9PEZI|nr:hypothetical protein DOTSEDRAFT_48335 [Lecanosticta acicola]